MDGRLPGNTGCFHFDLQEGISWDGGLLQAVNAAFTEMAQPLYELAKGGLTMVEWTKLDYKGDWTKTRRKLVSQIHQGTHLGTHKFKELMGKQF